MADENVQEVTENDAQNEQGPEQVPPEVTARHKAAECAAKINDVLKEYSFMLSVSHEIVSTKNSEGKTMLDIDHQIRFVEPK